MKYSLKERISRKKENKEKLSLIKNWMFIAFCQKFSLTQLAFQAKFLIVFCKRISLEYLWDILISEIFR